MTAISQKHHSGVPIDIIKGVMDKLYIPVFACFINSFVFGEFFAVIFIQLNVQSCADNVLGNNVNE